MRISMRRLLLSLTLLCASAACFAVPKVLVVQIDRDPKAAHPVMLDNALAESLEDEGKLDPIVWSQSDPVFRGAVLDGRVKGTDFPSPNDVQAALKALKCDYLILAQAQVKGTAIAGRIDLYKGTKPIWNNSTSMDPGRSAPVDLENAIRSVARTWAMGMSSGPLKSIKAEPKPPEFSAPSQGQIPKTSTTDQTPPTDSSQTLAAYQQLMAAKKVEEATNLLRQAVDANPLDPKLRVQLIQHLRQIGRSRDAAEEARRAAALLPDNQEIRAIAAQAYLDSGQGDQAEAQLNEALARNPEDPVTRRMLADLAMKAQKPQAAIDHIDVAMKKAPSKDLAYRRALCDAVLGDSTAVQNDLAQGAQISTWNQEEDTYRFCMGIFDEAMDQSVGDLRSLNQRAVVRREDPDVSKAIDDQLAILQARQMLIDDWTPPQSHKKSQGMLSLALKLLAQSLSGLKAYLTDGSQDTLTDSGIDLGEAIKQLSAAKDALAAEQGSVARDGSTTVYSYH